MPGDGTSGAKNEPARNARKWWYRAGTVASLICLFYFGHRALTLGDSLSLLTEDALARLALAVLPYLLSCFAAAWGWRYVLQLLGVKVRLSVAASIFLTTQFGKYLPGNFAHHVGRVTVAKRYGLPMLPVLTSMVVESGLALGIFLLFSATILGSYIEPEPIWLLGAGAAAVLIGVGIWFRRQGLRAVCEAAGQAFSISTSRLRWIVPILISAAGAILSGSSLLLLDSGFTERFDTTAYVFSLFCAAWVAGFLTPGAPAGLGIRELVLCGGLAPIVGIERATAAAILLRAVTTASDLLAFGIGLMLLHRATSARAEQQTGNNLQQFAGSPGRRQL